VHVRAIGDRQAVDISQHNDLIRVAHLLADAARPETLKYFRKSGLATEDKSSPDALFDPVTVADRASEAASYTHLRAHETILDIVCRFLLEKQKLIHTLIRPYLSLRSPHFLFLNYYP